MRIDGQVIYLGKHGSPESHNRYAAVVDQWRRTHQLAPSPTLSIDKLALLYLSHAQ